MISISVAEGVGGGTGNLIRPPFCPLFCCTDEAPPGYPFQRRFLERGIKNCGSPLFLLLIIVADYEEAFI